MFVFWTSYYRNCNNSITAAHGSFNGIRQMAPIRSPSIIYPWALVSLSPSKQHYDRACRFGRVYPHVTNTRTDRQTQTTLYIQGGPKNLAQFFCTPLLYQILTDLQNYFTVRIRRKFAIILSQKSHHTWTVSLHYLVKCQVSSKLKTWRLLQQHILRNQQQETMSWVSQLLSKVTVTFCNFYIKCLHFTR